ncbi:hypothetical protein SLE2022_404660 [Rubroshorea leprosula]
MFRSSSPLLRKSEPPVQVQDTIITAWTIRHPTRNRNDPIARAELYQLSYIPRAKWSMHERVRCFFLLFFSLAQLGHPGLEPETSPVK